MSMKIPVIPNTEKTVKQSFNLKASTVAKLQQYQDCYAAVHGGKAPQLTAMVELMLLTLMSEDKEFQRFLRDAATPPAAPTRERVEPPRAMVTSSPASADSM